MRSNEIARVVLEMPKCASAIADVLTAHEVSVSGGVMVHAHGVGLAWRLPNVAAFKTNLLLRDNRNEAGTTWQFSAGWFVPFSVGRPRFVISGFADVFGPEGDLPAGIVSDLQMLMDVVSVLGGDDWRVFAGVEWHYRRSSPRQLVPQAVVRWTF